MASEAGLVSVGGAAAVGAKQVAKESSSLYGLSIEQAIGVIAAHESVHASDKNEIHADIQYEQQGKIRPIIAGERKPEQVEKKDINELKHNK